MKRTIWFLFTSLIIFSFVLAACSPTAPTEAPPAATEAPPAETEAAPAETEAMAPEGEPIKIGASLPMTGAFAINGEKHRDGYQLCVDLINEKGGLLGRPVELIVSDNQSDVETTMSQVERFLNVDNVDLIFGTFSSRLTFPMSSVLEQAGMVHPIPSGAALRIYLRGYKTPFYFQQKAAEYVGESPINMVKELVPEGEQPTTAAVVYADDFFAGSIANGLLGGNVEVEGEDDVISLAPGLIADAGMELVYEEMWPEGYSDWITLANSLKESGAEFVFGLTASPDETIQLARAMQTVEYQPKGVYLSQGSQQEFADALGDAANGITIHAAWHPAVQWEGLLAGEPYTNQDFQADFKAKFNRDADEDEAIPFALCQGMEQAVLGTGGTDNAAIIEWLRARTADDPVKTIIGDRYWDERGLPINADFVMVQWQDGDLAFVYPVGEFPGTSDLVWPKPEW
ncbi:MAG: amino acid ABC transporter substrate-binding protein [Anaerolineales bacterium]